MKNNAMKEIIISSILVVLAVLLLNPFQFWMPDMFMMAILASLFVVFVLFASFVLQEKAQDEREVAHKMLSGRVAFLAGAAILTLGIIVQAFSHRVDVWLVGTLVVMVVSKVATRIYTDSHL